MKEMAKRRVTPFTIHHVQYMGAETTCGTLGEGDSLCTIWSAVNCPKCLVKSRYEDVMNAAKQRTTRRDGR